MWGAISVQEKGHCLDDRTSDLSLWLCYELALRVEKSTDSHVSYCSALWDVYLNFEKVYDKSQWFQSHEF